MTIQKKANRGASEFHIEISIPNLEALIRPPIKKGLFSVHQVVEIVASQASTNSFFPPFFLFGEKIVKIIFKKIKLQK